MSKEFILPFRLGKKQNRAVLDANGQEVVIFPKGCEYLASKYVELINDSLHSYNLNKTAGDIAKQYNCAIGTIGCPHCGTISIGAIITNKCTMCDNDRFDIKLNETKNSEIIKKN